MNEAYYPEQLPGRYTGGFGEDTCHSCHFDYPLNYEVGSLRVEGIPGKYRPGTTYEIRIRVNRPDLRKAGFQMAARFPGGGQAGRFRLSTGRVGFTKTDSVAVQYVQHSTKGTEPQTDTSATWSVTWTAPGGDRPEIVFNIAANAGNGDVSEFGDYILAREIHVKVAGKR